MRIQVVVLHIDSAVGYEGDIILSTGIDNDDYVILYFSNRSNGYNIDYNNIDSIFQLSNDHTWLNGDGLIRGAQWNNDSTQLLIALSNNNGVPTMVIGDTIFPNRNSIKIYDNKTPVKGIVEITGSFDPVGIEQDKTLNTKFQNNLFIEYRPLSMDLVYFIPDNTFIELMLYDITGREIIKRVYNKQGEYILNLSNYHRGIYFINLRTTSNTMSKKIIVF